MLVEPEEAALATPDAGSSPADGQRVLCAFRFGWALAESRGRLRTGETPGIAAPRRPEHALPLGDERGWQEQTIETEEVVSRLAETLKLDFQMDQQGSETASARLKRLSKELQSERDAGHGSDAQSTWNKTAEFFFQWDARIQDTLAADSFAVASAYQLGRGLAETFWALDPRIGDDGDPRSAQQLLGLGRQQAFSRLLPRLSTYFTPATTTAIAASVDAWKRVADDGLFHEHPAVVNALHEQLRVWHDLMLIGQAPEARIDAKDLLARARRIGPVLKAFLPEVAAGLVSLASAGAAAALFALGTGSHAIAPVLSVLSVFGVTGATALARVKGQAHTLFDELRGAMDVDLTKEAVTLPPARTYLDQGKRRLRPDNRKERALRELADSLVGRSAAAHVETTQREALPVPGSAQPV